MGFEEIWEEAAFKIILIKSVVVSIEYEKVKEDNLELRRMVAQTVVRGSSVVHRGILCGPFQISKIIYLKNM